MEEYFKIVRKHLRSYLFTEVNIDFLINVMIYFNISSAISYKNQVAPSKFTGE